MPDRRLLPLVCVVLALIACVTSGCGSAASGGQSRYDTPPDDAASSGAAIASPGDGSVAPGRLGNYLAQLPKFAAPPPAQPIPPSPGPLTPIYKRIPTTQPVAFLTIDDGLYQLPDDLSIMQAAHIPFTMFLIGPVAAQNPAFFKQLEEDGGVVEDHTITHPEMRGKAYPFQQHEVCAARTSLEHEFGTTLHLFRPPFGDYDQTTLRAVHDCGLHAAFYWSETANYGLVNYQTPDHVIHPGDIILMHFRPAFVRDLIAALTAIHAAGLTPALLENYIQ